LEDDDVIETCDKLDNNTSFAQLCWYSIGRGTWISSKSETATNEPKPETRTVGTKVLSSKTNKTQWTGKGYSKGVVGLGQPRGCKTCISLHSPTTYATPFLIICTSIQGMNRRTLITIPITFRTNHSGPCTFRRTLTLISDEIMKETNNRSNNKHINLPKLIKGKRLLWWR
jgi:hypothetical protein